MTRVSLIVLAGLWAANFFSAKGDNVFDDIEDWFIDIGDDIENGWNSVEDFFVGDEWKKAMDGLVEQDWGWPKDTLNPVVDWMEGAWEWTESAAISVWTETEDFFHDIGCMVEGWSKYSCISCVKQECNDKLSYDIIDQIDAANDIAIMDMNGVYDAFFQGCASAMETCPLIEDCKQLHALPESTRQILANEITQCNLCYTCLPYASTKEGCQVALDASFPNNCAGCSESQQGMYNAFAACSSLKVMHDSIAEIGESYKPGGTGHYTFPPGDGRKSLDNICKYCENCSNYSKRLHNTCEDWNYINTAPNCPSGSACCPKDFPNCEFGWEVHGMAKFCVVDGSNVNWIFGETVINGVDGASCDHDYQTGWDYTAPDIPKALFVKWVQTPEN